MQNNCHSFYYENSPSSWAYAKLSDVAFITMGQSPSGSDISNEKKNNSAEFHQGKLAFGDEIIKHSNRYAINFKKIAEANSILFCVRAPVGELNLTNRVVAIGRGLCSIKPFENILDLRFLYFALMYLKPFIIDKGGGSTFDEITVDIIKKIIIPIPPLREQILIAKKIKGAFEVSKAITKNKEHIANKTAILKSKILDSIFGENSSYKSYYKNGSLIDDIEIYDNLRKPISLNEREKRVENAQTLYPYFGATGQTGVIDDFILEGEYVLLGEDGAPFLDKTADKAYLVQGKIWVNNHAHVLKSKTNNKFLMYYLNWFDYFDFVSGTTRLKLNQTMMKKIPFPIVSKDIKKNIVDKIERAFAILNVIN